MEGRKSTVFIIQRTMHGDHYKGALVVLTCSTHEVDLSAGQGSATISPNPGCNAAMIQRLERKRRFSLNTGPPPTVKSVQAITTTARACSPFFHGVQLDWSQQAAEALQRRHSLVATGGPVAAWLCPLRARSAFALRMYPSGCPETCA